jgi:pilus assembly protein CpaB
MNWKTWVPLLVAIVFALVAANAAHDWMLKNKHHAQAAGTNVKVVVAKANIPPGSALRAEDLEVVAMEQDRAPSGAFKSIDQVAGRISETLVVKNQAVVDAMLAPQGAGGGLQALVPPGMRAITVEVNEFSGVAGMLQPGAHVDILATLTEGANNRQIARTIVQNVKVTAVGRRTTVSTPDAASSNASNDPVKSVTVLASPSDAEAIELACSTGRPRLVLRSGGDSKFVDTPGITLGELCGSTDTPVDPRVAVAPPIVPATQPAVVVVTPTTEPAIAEVTPEPPHRKVKMIKAGVESVITLNALDGVDPTATANTDPFER